MEGLTSQLRLQDWVQFPQVEMAVKEILGKETISEDKVLKKIYRDSGDAKQSISHDHTLQNLGHK